MSKFAACVRLAVTGTAFHRDDEALIARPCSPYSGVTCMVKASFGNGRVEEFLLDQNLAAAHMKTPKICACIGAAMACFHFTSLPRLPRQQTRNPVPIVWNRLRGWAKEVRKLCSDQEIAECGLDTIQAEVGASLSPHLLLPPWAMSGKTEYRKAAAGCTN